MSESDLGRLMGKRSLGNAVLSGRRAASKSHIRILADYFKVMPICFCEQALTARQVRRACCADALRPTLDAG